jgi:predicted metalloprotease
MTIANRQFTQRAFSSLSDEQTGGNLPLEDLLAAIGPDLDRFFGALVRGRNAPWTPPALARGSAACDGDGETQGPTAFCPSDRSVKVDTGRDLVAEHRSIGDYATGTLLASRYGLAALAAMGRPTQGADAGRRALCLAGAYTGSVGQPGTDFGLSPGDLDEAVTALLVLGRTGTSGGVSAFDRITAYRDGVLKSLSACG